MTILCRAFHTYFIDICSYCPLLSKAHVLQEGGSSFSAVELDWKIVGCKHISFQLHHQKVLLLACRFFFFYNMSRLAVLPHLKVSMDTLGDIRMVWSPSIVPVLADNLMETNDCFKLHIGVVSQLRPCATDGGTERWCKQKLVSFCLHPTSTGTLPYLLGRICGRLGENGCPILHYLSVPAREAMP